MTDLSFHSVIIEQLYKIEQEEQVRILYACESGSRAWGFLSKDSDYDVRFIYIRPTDWYLSIFEKRDVIERPIDHQLDISGWDLRKALLLFRKSNPPLLEWLQSPVPYMEKYSVADRIRSLSPLAFSPRSCVYHYLNMAKGNYREYLQGEHVRIKKYFYVLRPILACCWIEQHGTMPPMEFERLLEALLPEDSELKATIRHLLTRKKAGDELNVEPKLHLVNAYLEERIAHFEQEAAGLKFKSVQASQQQHQLDALFRSALQEVWG